MWLLSHVLIAPTPEEVFWAIQECQFRLKTTKPVHYVPTQPAGVSMSRPSQRHRRGAWTLPSVIQPSDYPFSLAWLTTDEDIVIVRLSGLTPTKDCLRLHAPFRFSVTLQKAREVICEEPPHFHTTPPLVEVVGHSPDLLAACLASPRLTIQTKLTLSLACMP